MDDSGSTVQELSPLRTSSSDDEVVLREATSDDFANHVAPASWRTGRSPIAMAWLAIATAIFWLVTASSTALVVGAVPAIIGMVVTALLFAAASHVLSRYATRTGITVVMFSRMLFGGVGARLVALLLGATGIYYGAFEASATGIAFHHYFGGPPVQVWYLIMTTGAVLLALGGIRAWLDRLNRYLLPLYALGMVGMLVWATLRYGYHADWLTVRPAGGTVVGPRWLFAASVYLGQAVLLLFVWDYARLARVEDAGFNARVTFGAPFWLFTFVVNGLVGIYVVREVPLSSATSETSLLLGVTSLMGIPGLAFLWVLQARINTANYYVASINLHNLFGHRRLRRPHCVVLAGAAVYAITLSDVFSFLFDALRYQGAVIASWLVVAVLFALGSPDAEFRPRRLPRLNVAGLAGWLSGAAVAIVLLATAAGFGDTWALPIGMACSALVYLALRAVSPRRAPGRTDPYDPRLEVEDPWSVRIRCGHCERHYLAVEFDRDPAAGHVPICAACAVRRPQARHGG